MDQPDRQPPRPGHTGFFFDDVDMDSAWIREEAAVRLPPLQGAQTFLIRGRFLDQNGLGPLERGHPSLTIGAAGGDAQSVTRQTHGGEWKATVRLDARSAREGAELRFILSGVDLGNALAWLGRVTGAGPLQRFRRQARNRQLRVLGIETEQGMPVCDFSQRGDSLAAEFLHALAKPGLNVVGWLDAELGIGEGARCMLRAAHAAGVPAAPVQLRIPCRAARGNTEFTSLPPDAAPPHRVNVFHLDPPASREIDRRHGPALRKGRRNIGYWAWELGEFPDAWSRNFEPFDEIWCPSDFVREAVALKSPVPVLTMPHAVSLAAPEGDGRARFDLPRDAFLFLFAYDLHSYSARKNPAAALRAFRQAGFGDSEAGLVIKVHGEEGNAAALETLRAEVEKTPGARLITGSLSRADLTLLTASCDCFVSLHRAEGFGLAVAEAMALGRPVIATDWSATAEYLNPDNGCPVRHTLVPVGDNCGPYPKNGYWAEPDEAHAADWMRTLAADRDLARRLGAAAAATIAGRFAPPVVGARYLRRLQALALFG